MGSTRGDARDRRALNPLQSMLCIGLNSRQSVNPENHNDRRFLFDACLQAQPDFDQSALVDWISRRTARPFASLTSVNVNVLIGRVNLAASDPTD